MPKVTAEPNFIKLVMPFIEILAQCTITDKDKICFAKSFVRSINFSDGPTAKEGQQARICLKLDTFRKNLNQIREFIDLSAYGLYRPQIFTVEELKNFEPQALADHIESAYEAAKKSANI